jgi:peptidyl-prolyl cis-trans isomerase D
MKKRKASEKIGSFLILGLFAVIILSFVLTGFQSNIQFMASGGGVAVVDGNAIKIEEYQRALTRQLKFYEQMFGGKALSKKQIEQFGVKRTVLKRLIDQKLIENLANDLSIGASQKEVVSEIEKMPYFQKNGGFDLIAYKRLLGLNGFSTETFEENVSTDLKVRKIEQLLTKTNHVSKGFAKFYTQIKDNNLTSYAARFSKESLRSKLPITSGELKTYLTTNTKTLETTYNSRKGTYIKPAQVRASHILIKVNPSKTAAAALKEITKIRKTLTIKNFADMAKKHSQDSSAEKGGDLNYFKKGQMVPPFEKVAFGSKVNSISKPVKTKFGYHVIWVKDKRKASNKSFKSVKSDLARELIRKGKNADLDKFFKKTVADIKNSFEAGNYSKVNRLKSKLGITYIAKDKSLNIIDKKLSSIVLSDKEVGEIFKDTTKNQVFDFSTDREAKIVRTLKVDSKKIDKVKLSKTIETNLEAQKQEYQTKFRTNLVKFLSDKADIVTYPKFL